MELPLPLKVITKIASFVCAGFIIALAIWSIFQVKDQNFIYHMNSYIMAVNTIILALVLALSELEWKVMEENFYLTANLFGRGIYLILIGTLVILESGSYPMATGIICMVTGGVYIIFYFAIPDGKAAPAPPSSELNVTIQ